MLNLEYQLEHINYLAENFRHADMSPEEFMKDMNSRGDGLWKMAARMMGAGLASQGAGDGNAGLLIALMSDNRAMLLKQTMAKTIENLPDREKKVIILRYNEGLYLHEIGKLLEVSESRVCQIHSQALRRLRKALKRVGLGT